MKTFLRNIPNILTIIRFLLIIPIMITLISEHYIAALVLYTVSSLTDVLDGVIARKFKFTSDFGKLADPLADKLTQLSIILGLSVKYIVPFWVFTVLMIKELLLVMGSSFLYGKKLVVYSRWYGKLTTVLIYIAVISSFIIKIFNLPPFDLYLYILAIIFAIISFIGYVHYFFDKEYLNKQEFKDAIKPKERPPKNKKQKNSKKNKSDNKEDDDIKNK